MAEYCVITADSIRRLRREWENFIDDCLDEVKKQYKEDSSSYYNEAYDDKMYDRYSEESIDEWYKDMMNDLDEWADSWKKTINQTYREGVKIIDEIASKKFYDDERRYSYTLNFCEGIVEKEYSYDDYDTISVSGMYWTIDKVEMHFDPSGLKFSEWMPVPSRSR